MGRRNCTEDNPYTDERDRTEPGFGWVHSAAEEIGDQEDGYPGGDIQRVRCGNCGIEWRKELPQ